MPRFASCDWDCSKSAVVNREIFPVARVEEVKSGERVKGGVRMFL
jgi:hypothetical protein